MCFDSERATGGEGDWIERDGGWGRAKIDIEIRRDVERERGETKMDKEGWM